MNEDPLVDVVVAPANRSSLDLHANFGVVVGRRATTAEVERLALQLGERVEPVSISIVDRHEFGGEGTAARLEEVHVSLSADAIERSGYEFDVLRDLVRGLMRAWVLECRQLPPTGDLTLAERLAPNTVSLENEPG